MSIDRRQFLVSAAVTGAVAAIAGPAEAAPPPDALLDDLVTRMTVAEKAGQLNLEAAISPNRADPDIAKMNPFLPPISVAEARAQFDGLLARITAGQVGALMSPMDLESIEFAQRAAVTRSRLKIPLLFAADIIHGCKTVFPVPLAEAASFEPELARRTARACAIEATATGLDVTFAPMVDIGRDQRWGRVVEGAGEDVLLGSLFAAARVAGFQGPQRGAADSLLACAKHFAAYGAAESGLDYQGALISERVLHEVYLPPFKAAFDAGAILTMAAFNTIDGVPSTGNQKLLTTVLRDRFGFPGAVISDFESEKELIPHGQAADEADAARIALGAGCDLGMISGIFLRHVPRLIEIGALEMATLDRAVRRLLFVKREAGLFDAPFKRVDRRRFRQRAPAAHRALAREAARKSIVLLKNDNAVLPLRKSGQRIALIGPFALDTANLNGPWSPSAPQDPSISFADGLRAAVEDAASLTVVPGAEVHKAIPGGIDAAVQAARAADVVVLALGESEDMSGEAASRTDIVMPPAQQALAEAVAATSKPIVVVLRNGRALALEGAVRDASAIVVAWFLGSETGPALAEILLGGESPSGRLPVTFPLASGQQPYYYARESSGRPALNRSTEKFKSHFLGIPDAPLYAFGHGLTYSEIRYGATQASMANGKLTIACTVTNAGQRAVEEVAQLYIHDNASEVVQPVRKLIAFRKIPLLPGQTQRVDFVVDEHQLAHLDQELNTVAPSGRFTAWIAPSAVAGEPTSFVWGSA